MALSAIADSKLNNFKTTKDISIQKKDLDSVLNSIVFKLILQSALNLT